MKNGTFQRVCLTIACLIIFAIAPSNVPAQVELLTLNEAVSSAIRAQDPTIAAFTARAEALEQRAVADGELPDPQVRFGFANWPVDTFDFEQENMTQIQAGLRQSFPRGRTRKLESSQRLAESRIHKVAAELAELEIAREVRRVWFELFYWFQAREIVASSSAAVGELVGVVEASFATGLQSNQELLRAELELALLDDRALDVRRRIGEARADLARYIGVIDAARALPTSMPSLPEPPSRSELLAGLVNHPAIRAQDAGIDVSDHSVSLAMQQYRPGWMVDVGYGVRGGNRADFASVMVSVDIPLFTERRQDRRLAAARSDFRAAQYGRDAGLLEMRQMIDRVSATHSRLVERIELFEQVVLKRADDAAEAALDGYQSQVTDFAELIRSQLAALDTSLKLGRLRVDHAQARAQLLFLAGGAP